MAQETVTTAQLACSFGAAPSALIAVPKGPPVLAGGQAAATILDFAPIANVAPFGMCSAPTNPAVAAATTAAAGVLTPQPCVPVTVAPWVPGSPTVLINGAPALSSMSKCMCAWAGVISIVSPGQVTVSVP
jgi:hypothetical protein